MEILTGFLEAVVRATLPLALAALGEMISQRAGFVNVGLEGAMIAGALAAAVAAAGGGTSWGYFSGALAGAGVGVILVIFAIGWRANQILTGAAVTSGALGITALLSHAAFGTTGAALSVPMSAIYRVLVILRGWAMPPSGVLSLIICTEGNVIMTLKNLILFVL
jgi:simple sugar transport system permease protein